MQKFPNLFDFSMNNSHHDYLDYLNESNTLIIKLPYLITEEVALSILMVYGEIEFLKVNSKDKNLVE